MCVIYGYNEVIVKEPETGVYLLSITALKPYKENELLRTVSE